MNMGKNILVMQMKTKYHVLPDKHFYNYFNYVIGKVWKILPMTEENNKDLKKHMESLQRELIGKMYLIEDLRCDGYFLTLLNKIEYLINEEYTHEVCRSEVFACISIINKIIEKYELDSGDVDG